MVRANVLGAASEGTAHTKLDCFCIFIFSIS